MAAIEALAVERDGLTLAGLGRALDLPKTSLLSLLRALERDGYVVNRHGGYRLGAAAIRLGALLVRGEPAVRRVAAALPALAARCGETALLAVPAANGREVTYTDIADGPEAIRYAAVVGTSRPLYCTAAGRVVMAFRGEAFTRRYLADAPRRAYTPRTVVDAAALRAVAAEVRRTGVAETRDQTAEGLWGFGAPVFDANRALVAAVMIAAPSERGRKRRQEFAAATRDAGEEMSRILGLAGDYIEPP
ncbi:MAG: helix-turn-helix domain-containing protein [Rhodospirillales bacterium]|nr:helix-turn-helix domain-containing protein [Rhodospirillales bacterium]